MADLKVINNLTRIEEDTPFIPVSMSNAIYQGPPGDPGVWVGENEPTNSSLIWINPIKGNVLQIRNKVGDPWKEVPYISLDRETFATKDYVADEIEKIPQPDLSKYALKSEIPSTSGLATEKYVDEKFNSIEVPDVDLSNYYTKTQVDNLIPSTSGLATIGYVNEKFNSIVIPDTSGFVSEDRVLELIEEHGGGGDLPASEEGEF